MSMSRVYENVFQTSETSFLPSVREKLLCTVCLEIPCNEWPTSRYLSRISNLLSVLYINNSFKVFQTPLEIAETH